MYFAEVEREGNEMNPSPCCSAFGVHSFTACFSVKMRLEGAASGTEWSKHVFYSSPRVCNIFFPITL